MGVGGEEILLFLVTKDSRLLLPWHSHPLRPWDPPMEPLNLSDSRKEKENREAVLTRGSAGPTHEEWLHGCTGKLGQWIGSVHRKKRKCLWWASSQSLPQCPITASIGIPQRPNLMCWTVEYFPYINPLRGETLTWWEHSVMKLSFHMPQSLLPLSSSRFPTLLLEKKKKNYRRAG